MKRPIATNQPTAPLIWLLTLLLWLPSTAVFAAEEIHRFDNPAQQLLYQQLTDELRCPKCQNQNIADSNAGIARDLRTKVYQLVQQGQDKQQVIDYMIERYGYFVYYKPPLTPGTLILWLLPMMFVLFTLILIWFKARRSQQATGQPQWNETQEAQLATLIDSIQGEQATNQAVKKQGH